MSGDKTENALPKTKTSTREFDDLYDHVKTFGKYQRILYFSVSLLLFPIANQFSGLVFAYGTPKFNCVTANVTCPPKKCCDECTSYVFDGPFHSSISEWNLICDRAYLGAVTQSCFLAGLLVGSILTGMVSDTWGRKKCIFFSLFIMLVAGVSSSFADCVSLFSFLRFVVGFGVAGVMLTHFILCMELVGPKQRTTVATVLGFYWLVSGTSFVGLAYLIRDWRILTLVSTVPAVLLFPFWRWIPESPRWLIAHNQLDEAHRVLMLYGGKKGKPVDSQLLRTMIDEIRRDQIAKEKNAKKYTPLDLVRTPKLRKWTIIVGCQWFSVAFLAYGILLFISQLAGNVYINVILMRVLGAPLIPLKWFMYLKAGRRVSQGLLIITSGITLLLVLSVSKNYPSLTTGLFIVGAVLSSHCWSGVYLITSELYPTVLRNTAQGTGSGFARLGGILAPYVAMMGQLPSLGVEFPAAIFGVFALVSGVLLYWIPETLRSPMHQTIEEAEAAKDYYGLLWCGKPLKQNIEPEASEEQARDSEAAIKDTADMENGRVTEEAVNEAHYKGIQ